MKNIKASDAGEDADSCLVTRIQVNKDNTRELSGMKIKKYLLIAAVIGMMILFMTMTESQRTLILDFDVEEIQDFILAYGVWSRFVFLALGFIRPLLVIPVSFFFVTGGLAFGTLEGSFWALLGMAGSTTAIYFFSSRFHRMFRRMVDKKYIEMLYRVTEKDLVPKIFSIRVTPGMPFDSITVAGGLTRVQYKKFMTGTILGMLPKGVLYTYLGENLDNYLSPETLVVYGILIAMAIAPHIYQRFKRKGNKQDI